MELQEISDTWDFYPCLVDDAPASIFLNLGYAPQVPIPGADTFYWCRIQMRDADDHGLGSGREADVLHAVEDAIVDAVRPVSLFFVGRLRHQGSWQLAFFGPRGQERHLAEAAQARLADSGRTAKIGSKPDALWSFYTDFLYPDEERMQWMQDRRLVTALASHGDPLTAARRVDHWAFFPDPARRAAFLAAAVALGFELAGTEDDGEDEEHPFGCQVHRVDGVQLEEIHEVVMRLSELARERAGRYDGWETKVKSSG